MNTIATELLHSQRMMKLFVWSSLVALFVTFGMYIYLVNKTVFNVVARQNAERQIADLNSKVSDMEFKSMALKDTVTLEKAHELGFTEVTAINFVTPKAPAKNLSFNLVE